MGSAVSDERTETFGSKFELPDFVMQTLFDRYAEVIEYAMNRTNALKGVTDIGCAAESLIVLVTRCETYQFVRSPTSG